MPGLKEETIGRLKKRLIVSCQAEKGNPMLGLMPEMAVAAAKNGAGGIRAEGEDVFEIRKVVQLPLIGLIKQNYPGFDPYITPTIEEVEKIISWGADIVAADATGRPRPDKKGLKETIDLVHSRGKLFMADIATLAEGKIAATLGADLIGTTLSGYTEETKNLLDSEEPDWQLLQDLLKVIESPVILEGRVWTPLQARRAIELGAWSVVVGSAITRPQRIVERYVQELSK
jgi:N-acylglucosamine-6-phosphate 2-epimerase